MSVNTSYPEAIPFQSDTARTLAAEQGPKCAKAGCGKPKFLAKELGGCDCPRFSDHPGELNSHKTMVLRQTESSERLNQLLEVYLKHLGLEIPPSLATGPSEVQQPTGVAVVDNFRAKHETTKKVS